MCWFSEVLACRGQFQLDVFLHFAKKSQEIPRDISEFYLDLRRACDLLMHLGGAANLSPENLTAPVPKLAGL